jgi:hypothetical protein
VVNALFKRELQEINGFPKKSEMIKNLPFFVEKVSDCIYHALNPTAIRKGFYIYNTYFILYTLFYRVL